ncbi:sensor domain-containing diguanylate cyclase [Nitratidesulfovibrio sp. SRB-5]|uniref:sensor domain-containing diguanylate cyclase n=1 Tax=Nitratidesulfovibrio sp. SRB-5 TaxID=2872636 RepID=UPI0010271844|nr:sensor domain-containing diguanylate cyclase [Nitratidesulfovibrio sp. SRB-5]MBZ2171415.1 sensor domain-containing diguanylate cyclase [Nitratidesulfovibrio sp. SRB-5]RXF78333.1 GGDEF domain-containing protein [Desulfovibrio sp. DS-1]
MASFERHRNTPTMGVRGWLLLLALVAGLPTTMFSVFAMVEHMRAQQEKTDAELRRQVLAVAQAVDAELSAKAAMLHALAASQDPERMDIGQLYRQAKGVGSVHREVQSLALAGHDGNQVFNTWEPLGVVLPPTGDLASVRRALDEDRPVVSDLFQGSILLQPVTALGVPMQVDRGHRYVLRMYIGVAAYARLLEEERLPEGWASTLVDGQGTILARTLRPEVTVGQVVGPRLREMFRSSEVMEADNREGDPVRFAVAPVGGWGWHAVVQVPVAMLQAAMRDYLLHLAGIGGACIVMGFAGAWLLSRRFVREVELAARSCLLPQAEDEPARRTMVRELRQVGDELAAAREREEMALRDGLTGLAGRALFLRHARRLLETSRHDTSLRLAVMFIDLDGFKQLNDQYGHAEGDAVLLRTARVLEGAVRSSDVVGRLGGDEFVLCLVLQADTACEVARGVAARVVSGVAQIGLGVGCSVGIALGRTGGYPELSEEDAPAGLPDDGTDAGQAAMRPEDAGAGTGGGSGGADGLADGSPHSVGATLPGAPAPLRVLLEEADKAMYVAKQAGKNSYHLQDMSTCE